MRSRAARSAIARPQRLESDYKTVQTRRGNRQHRRVATERRRAARSADRSCANRLFFFGAVDPQWQTTTFVAPRRISACSRSATSIAIGTSRTTPRKARGSRRPSHRFDASFFGDPATGAYGAAALLALLGQTTSAYSSLEFGGHNQTVHYDGVLSPHFLVDASFGRALNRIFETPSVNEWQVRDFRVSPRSRRRSRLLRGRQPQRQLAGSGEGHDTISRPLANIRFATAFDYEHLDFSRLQQYTGPDVQRAERAADRHRRRPRHHSGSDVRANLPREPRPACTTERPTTQHYTAFFVEDAWKIGNSLTIRPGVRYEQENMSGTHRAELLAQEQLGAAPRRRLGSQPERQG